MVIFPRFVAIAIRRLGEARLFFCRTAIGRSIRGNHWLVYPTDKCANASPLRVFSQIFFGFCRTAIGRSIRGNDRLVFPTDKCANASPLQVNADFKILVQVRFV